MQVNAPKRNTDILNKKGFSIYMEALFLTTSFLQFQVLIYQRLQSIGCTFIDLSSLL